MTPDEALDRLYRAGWSVGETCAGRTWLVCGANGENLIRATGRLPSLNGCSRPGIREFRGKRDLLAVFVAELGLGALPKRGSFPGIGCSKHSNQERTPHDPV